MTETSPSQELAVGSLVRQTFAFILLNIPATLLVCLAFFVKSIRDVGASVAANFLMLVSNSFLLSLLPLAVLFVLSVVVRSRMFILSASALVAGLFQAFLIIDLNIFSLFKFHINGLILNFLTTEGAGDSLQLGTATILTIVAGVLLILFLETLLARQVFLRGFGGAALGRKALVIAAGALLVIIADKAVYAYADLTNRIPILASARYYPYYPKLTVKGIASRRFGFQVDREQGLNTAAGARTLNYPLAPLSCPANGKRYHILFILVDGLRADMLTPEVMPNLHRFGRRNFLFRDHFSGGNGTRFGIFSLFYGLYGNLWHPFLEARQGPLLIDILKDKNYAFTVNASTRLTFPEFRRTVFVKIPEAVFDEHPKQRSSAERDLVLVERFETFLAKRERARPFFGFVFFNCSHYFYGYPPSFRKFTPVVKESFNYAQNISAETAQKLKNRYKNSLSYIDSLITRIVAALRRTGTLQNTIIVITGDHGEEFQENGFFTHNSAFDDDQIRTPLLMHIPGEKPRQVARLTSHLDVVPTLFTLLGCTTPPEQYSHGRNILSQQPRDYVFSSDWSSGAMVTKRYRIIIPIMAGRGCLVEVRTGDDYRLVGDEENGQVLKQYRPRMLEVAKNLAAFLK